jgi:[acyl-carrier-protein] S-malonyltransferase
MKLAFLFPGQGSQALHMMDALLEIDIIKNTFNMASEILNTDLLNVMQDNVAINLTINTQPLMLVAGYATYLLAQQHEIIPSVIAGHSLGEWTALVASEVITFQDALVLVANRAKFMQNSPQGSMLAVMGLEYEKINTICSNYDNMIEVANVNSTLQIIVAGKSEYISKSIDLFKQAGAKKVQLLPISIASHCHLMKDAAKELANLINKFEFKNPKIPIIHNCNASVEHNSHSIKDIIIKQMYSPVLWMQTIEQIYQSGIQHFVECGPNKILSSLNKRINQNITNYQLHCIQDFTNLVKN